jgi:hypothetical protein
MNSFEKQLYEFLQITNPVILQEELNKVRDGSTEFYKKVRTLLQKSNWTSLQKELTTLAARG